jgi:hypothetical protein
MEPIFVSYSRRQLYFAESVVLHLQKAGLEVWFDLQKLTPGVDWSAALKDGYTACDRLLLIVSQAALQSPYVQVEWESALQKGHEIILVLTEAVSLPEALRHCAVYDARTHFDRTMQSLVAYLRGKEPARRDPVPAPGTSPYSLSLPFDIWLSLGVMSLPTLAVWIATVALSPSFVDFNINLDSLTNAVPGLPVQAILFYGAGLLAGLYLALVYFPIRAFWQHHTPYEELEKMRWKVLSFQTTMAVAVLVASAVGSSPDRWAVSPIGYLVFAGLLVSAYWSFWVLPRSPDILRWLPSGQADQEVREAVQMEFRTDPAEPMAQEDARLAAEALTLAIHHDPADAHNARFIESVLKSEGCRSTPAHEANTHLVIVSNRTSKQWLLDLEQALSGQVIHILTTNINTPPDLQPVLQTQWVDFRSGRVKTLRALAAQLMDKERADISYGLQIAPTGFDTESGFPRHIGYILGFFYLIIFPLALGLAMFMPELPEGVAFAIFLIPAAALVLYVDALVMRRTSLPPVVQKWLGHRAAWFASRAPAAPDSLGNADRKYIFKLTSWTNMKD